MKNRIMSVLVIAVSLLSIPVLAQTENPVANDTALLGLPGDNLDLVAVMDLFQKSKTIEEFEKTLNEEKTGINNLDLDLDNKVDFIKVETKQKDDDFTFILQVDVSNEEKQDVAVILVSKDIDKKITLQVVGDKDLYGENFIVEPKTSTIPPVTANPAYTGDKPVIVNVPATTTTVVVESAPIVQYVYSPVYVPYYPPYHYGYYPPYYAAFTVMAVGIYRHNHYHYHGYGGYGYHGNTTVIHNTNNYNNYNNSRNSSNTVNHNKASGNYNRNNASTRQSGASVSNRQAGGASASTRQSGGASASTRQSGGASASTRQSGGASASTRQSSASRSNTSAASRSNYSNASRSGSSRSGGYSGGGGSARGGGGGGRRR